jgi:hypothetical protein
VKILAAALLLGLVAFACATRPPEANTYPLLSATIQTADGMLAGRIPQGWASALTDTLPAGVDAWLISDDRSAFMALREINLDRQTSQRVREEGLELLARLSIALRADSARGTAAVPVRTSALNNVSVCSYELGGSGEWRNIIVLAVQGRYYECEANVAKGTPDLLRRVTDAQRAFCGSLTTLTRE